MSGVTTIQRSTRSSRRNAHVAVVEHRRGIEQHLEDQHGHGRRAERRDDGELDPHREQDLDRVEARSGRDVELEVGMMHAVQPPQRRHGMEQHVLQVDREIERNDGQQNRKPRGQADDIKEPPAARLHTMASPTAVIGNRSRTRRVSRTTTARLLGQRMPRRRSGAGAAPAVPRGP